MTLGGEPFQFRLPAIAVITVAFLLSASRYATCQQISPFEGQGLDPLSVGLAYDNTPVYLNLLLEKLVEVNGKHAC